MEQIEFIQQGSKQSLTDSPITSPHINILRPQTKRNSQSSTGRGRSAFGQFVNPNVFGNGYSVTEQQKSIQYSERSAQFKLGSNINNFGQNQQKFRIKDEEDDGRDEKQQQQSDQIEHQRKYNDILNSASIDLKPDRNSHTDIHRSALAQQFT